jgi:hypothetical protein
LPDVASCLVMLRFPCNRIQRPQAKPESHNEKKRP